MTEKLGVKIENCYIDRELPSGRMLSQWRNCDPASMEAMSKAAVRFALTDAKTDITALAARVAELEAELERASQPGSGEAKYMPCADECGNAVRVGEDSLCATCRGEIDGGES